MEKRLLSLLMVVLFFTGAFWPSGLWAAMPATPVVPAGSGRMISSLPRMTLSASVVSRKAADRMRIAVSGKNIVLFVEKYRESARVRDSLTYFSWQLLHSFDVPGIKAVLSSS